MGFSVMLRGAEKLVPAEYWCPYGTYNIFNNQNEITYAVVTYCKAAT